MAKANLPTPELTEAEDGTWTLTVPGICTVSGQPAPEWAVAKAVEKVRRAASDTVRSWINGKPVGETEKQIVLLVTRGDTQVYDWLHQQLLADRGR